MAQTPASVGIVGALEAFPQRLAARAVAGRGGRLHRGVTRQTQRVVIGRKLIGKSEAEIEAKLAALKLSGVKLLSENAFLRWLHLMEAPERAEIGRRSMLEQSRLDEDVFDRLVLFDAFEHDSEPFSFRDLILAKKYAGLVAGGAGWLAVVRSVHHAGPVASLTALSLHPDGPGKIYAGDAANKSELDGQRLLPLEPPDDDTEAYFALAEQAEDAKLHAEATVLYGRCLALDPSDSVASYNRANCFRALGEADEAAAAYALAIKLDPGFVEAWFNFAALLRDEGKIAAARQHLKRAIAIDPDYADAIYNLASLEFDAGELAAARAAWARYLELDQDSEWARTASRGIAFVDLNERKSAS
ncbi:MAG: O-linked GlcNAc transferase [Devosia sp. 67-54]|uniref:tetratricopeptide repeat protein n=1 Tax=unclassified Devosia TaxID=196773 RepID=UPI0009601387|nr:MULTISPECIES: tetratricopeptide repeat protein [unclassified Devosia]MBN9307478.1 tetratricopeptide repeat protein [Devosia sp.]OJX16855.1 MAG: O-linked GlcNAc transferase [Devosia sp. 67-54]